MRLELETLDLEIEFLRQVFEYSVLVLESRIGFP